jgi:hypothetical protein
MKVVPIAKTLACSTGSVLIYAGLYTYSAEKLLDYLEVKDEAARDFVLVLSTLSTMAFITITRATPLWERFSQGNKPSAQPTSKDGCLTMLLKATILINAFLITALFGCLSAKSLLNLVGMQTSGIIIATGFLVSLSAFTSYLAFLYEKIAGPNIALISEFFSDLHGNGNRFNRKAALSAIALSLLAIISHTIFMNFAIKGALEVFPGLKEAVDNQSQKIIAGILALTNIPTLVLNYLMQAYRFFDPQQKNIALKTKSTRLTKASYLLLAATGLVFLSILGGGAYISIIDVIKQAGLGISDVMIQVLAIASAMSVFFSDYVLTFRAVEAYVVRWLNEHYHPENDSSYTSLLSDDDDYSSDLVRNNTEDLEEAAVAPVDVVDQPTADSSVSIWAGFYDAVASTKQTAKWAFSSSTPHSTV